MQRDTIVPILITFTVPKIPAGMSIKAGNRFYPHWKRQRTQFKKIVEIFFFRKKFHIAEKREWRPFKFAKRFFLAEDL